MNNTLTVIKCAAITKIDERTSQNCSSDGRLECSRCHLVKYRGHECQKNHWPKHRDDCNHALRKADWKPRWAFQGLGPMQSTDYAFYETFKYLWGNTPAYDCLQLERNEGAEYSRNLSLLYAASGDPRNIITTLNSLPNTFRSSCRVVINDREDAVTARSVVILLVPILEPSEEAAQLMLHLLYSSRLPPALMSILSRKIMPELANVVADCANDAHETIFSKYWSLQSTTLSVHLSKRQWTSIKDTLQANYRLNDPEPNRQFITLSEIRRDKREREYYNLTPSMRLCSQKFRQSGVLLPFGHYDEDFTVPNPTLFAPVTGHWEQRDIADPLKSYHLSAILRFATGRAPTEDVNGRLYFYVLSMLTDFQQTVRRHTINFEVYGTDARNLPSQIQAHSSPTERFDRIEVSNVSDESFVGLEPVLALFSRLLKSVHDNPSATLISQFMDAINIAERDLRARNVPSPPGNALVLQIIDQDLPQTKIFNAADLNKRMLAEATAVDKEALFDRYMQMKDFSGCGLRTGMKMKERNTIVEKWPVGRQNGALDPWLVLKTGSFGDEAFIEWVLAERNT